eukprot:967449-Prorocentrum_lima.AAC.1
MFSWHITRGVVGPCGSVVTSRSNMSCRWYVASPVASHPVPSDTYRVAFAHPLLQLTPFIGGKRT